MFNGRRNAGERYNTRIITLNHRGLVLALHVSFCFFDRVRENTRRCEQNEWRAARAFVRTVLYEHYNNTIIMMIMTIRLTYLATLI